MKTQRLTNMQQNLLRMFAFDHTDDFAMELKSVINNHFQKIIEEESNRLWDQGVLNQEKLDSIRHENLHSLMHRM